MPETKWLLAALLLTLTLNMTVSQVEYKYVVLGRAIDEQRKPVPEAEVIVTAPTGEFVSHDNADSDGRIHFEQRYGSGADTARVIYVTGPVPADAIHLIYPPFDKYPSLVGARYAGGSITIKKNGEVDIGNVVVRVFYRPVKVALQDRSGRPLLRDAGAWRNVWLRVRDADGHVLEMTGMSINEINRGVNPADSSLMVALPEGNWWLDVSPNENKGPWLNSGALLRVNASTSNLLLNLRLP